jgi:hypothetical protein
VLDLAKSHAQDCPMCAGKVASLSKVNDALEQLRFSTMRMEAPARIERDLTAEFQRRTVARVPAVAWTGWRLVWGTAMALIVVAAGVALYPVLKPRHARVIHADGIRLERPTPQLPSVTSDATAEDSSIVTQEPSRHSKAIVSKNETANADAPTPEPIWQRSALPVSDDLSMNGGSNVVRVTLALSSLVALGVPVHPDMSDKRVTADVALDPFGAVIAIHLVKAMPRSE